MFSMTIVFGPTPVPWTLLFRTEETFNSAMIVARTPAVATFERENLTITDDYGQVLDVKRSAIHGIMYEDMTQSQLAYVERGLHQARNQIAAEQAARTDPVISNYRPMTQRQGPPVITPFNGAFRQ